MLQLTYGLYAIGKKAAKVPYWAAYQYSAPVHEARVTGIMYRFFAKPRNVSCYV